PAAGLLSAAQSGRGGVEQRQGRRCGPGRPEGSRADEGGRGRPPAPAAPSAACRSRLLRRPRAELHRSRRLKSTYEQSPWYLDRLDRFVEEQLLPEYNRGGPRRKNPAYLAIKSEIEKAERRGD